MYALNSFEYIFIRPVLHCLIQLYLKENSNKTNKPTKKTYETVVFLQLENVPVASLCSLKYQIICCNVFYNISISYCFGLFASSILTQIKEFKKVCLSFIILFNLIKLKE